MSESAYLNGAVGEFVREHPASDGWQTFLLGKGDSKFGINVLPAFLRDREARIGEENLWTSIEWIKNRGERRRRLLGGRRMAYGAGFDEKDWNGTIACFWKGNPVRICRFPLLSGGGDIQTLIAAKGIGTLESLWRGLRTYYRKMAGARSQINMLGDGTFPKPKDRWEELILPGSMVQDIRRDVEGFMKARRQYAALNLPYRRGLLFAGAPGSGKTKAVRVIAAQSKAFVLGVALKADIADSRLKTAFSFKAFEKFIQEAVKDFTKSIIPVLRKYANRLKCS